MSRYLCDRNLTPSVLVCFMILIGYLFPVAYQSEGKSTSGFIDSFHTAVRFLSRVKVTNPQKASHVSVISKADDHDHSQFVFVRFNMASMYASHYTFGVYLGARSSMKLNKNIHVTSKLGFHVSNGCREESFCLGGYEHYFTSNACTILLYNEGVGAVFFEPQLQIGG